MVSGTLSPSSSECFSPFPHGTRSLSVSRECSALPGGPGGFAQDSSCPALLRIPLHRNGAASGTGLSPAAGPLSSGFPSPRAGGRRGPTTPARRRHRTGLGWSPVARRYWGNHCLFSLPGGTGMFRFPPFAPARNKRAGDSPSDCRVVPFGHLRVTGHLHLTADFRSLPRPSSPP